MAAQEVRAADLETDQATVLGAPLDQPRRHEARLARRGTRDPIPLSRPQHPPAVGGHRTRPSHHSTGNRRCLISVTIGHRVPWRAGCSGMGMSGSEGGSGKRTGGNAGTAPRPDPTRSWRGASARAGAGSAAAGCPRAAARQHGHGEAGAGLRAGGRRPRAQCDEAQGERRWPTTHARASVRRPRRTTVRLAASPAQLPRIQGSSSPMRPSRPHGGDRSSRA